MKLSVSVPDELWERAQRTSNMDSPSKIVQRALNLLVAETSDDLAEIWDEHPFRLSAPGDQETCPVCFETVTMTRSGLRRHKGKTQFDLETDGICSGSHGPELQE